MERFFRSLKTEWVPQAGYDPFQQVKLSVVDYIIGYYSQEHNGGLAPNMAEEKFWNEYKTVAKIT
jgi:transposase InsO family protein